MRRKEWETGSGRGAGMLRRMETEQWLECVSKEKEISGCMCVGLSICPFNAHRSLFVFFSICICIYGMSKSLSHVLSACMYIYCLCEGMYLCKSLFVYVWICRCLSSCLSMYAYNAYKYVRMYMYLRLHIYDYMIRLRKGYIMHKIAYNNAYIFLCFGVCLVCMLSVYLLIH